MLCYDGTPVCPIFHDRKHLPRGDSPLKRVCAPIRYVPGQRFLTPAADKNTFRLQGEENLGISPCQTDPTANFRERSLTKWLDS